MLIRWMRGRAEEKEEVEVEIEEKKTPVGAVFTLLVEKKNKDEDRSISSRFSSSDFLRLSRYTSTH